MRDNTVPLRIASCNVRGGFFAKLRKDPLANLLRENDIILLQETHLREGEGEAIQRYCNTHRIISHSRPTKHDFKNPGGGVAAAVRSDLPITVLDDLSSTDVMTIKVRDTILMNVYVPPEGSSVFKLQTSNATIQIIADLIAAARLHPNPLVIVGDWNARTANKIPSADHPNRSSHDPIINTRGRELLEIMQREELIFLNGSTGWDDGDGNLTCFHSHGSSVVDYALISNEHKNYVTLFRVQKPSTNWTDHSALLLHVVTTQNTDNQSNVNFAAKPKRQSQMPVPGPMSELDIMLEDAIKSIPSRTDRLIAFYGPVTAVSDDTSTVYIASHKYANRKGLSSAGIGVFWRRGSTRNLSMTVTGAQTNERAVQAGLLHALRTSDPSRPLKVYCTTSSLTFLLSRKCIQDDFDVQKEPNADILKPIIAAMTERMAQVRLVVLESKNASHGIKQALSLASQAIMKSASPADPSPREPYVAVPPKEWKGCNPQPSVTTSIPKLEIHDKSTNHALRLPARSKRNKTSHRNRSSAAIIRATNKRAIADASPREYWRIINKLRNRNEQRTSLPIHTISREFKDRMNGIHRDTSHFDKLQMELAELMDKQIPNMTRDPSKGRHFSRPVTVQEVERLKAKLKEKSPRSAKGIDELSYHTLITIPSEKLVELFNSCIRKRDVPTAWLYTILIAILKARRPKDTPSSYRIIALESCFLKMLTLLIEGRLREWCEENNFLPSTQNGFRPGYRTNNNIHILRTAIDVTRRKKGKLYVAFVDLTNAFPSVDRATLWTKLRSYGISGPIFDCLRAIYPRKKYFVRSNNETSNTFESDIGILAGDPASPLAFLLYLADFRTPTDPDDIIFINQAISHLEHADDMVLLSTTHQGLQRKFDHLGKWASSNLMESNPKKCNVMVFGSSHDKEPPLHLYGDEIPFTDSYKYVGVLISSKGRSIFKLHYENKAQAGRIAAAAALSLRSIVGPIDPINGRKIYLAQIDPHLTAGCDICIDTERTNLRTLETVQETFIRRFLGLGDKALTAFLFTETGLWPIAYRRLSLAIQYLAYIITLPDAHLAKKATQAGDIMAQSSGSRGWYADITKIMKERTDFHLPPLNNVTSETIAEAQRAIKKALTQSLRLRLKDSPKAYLVRDTLCETQNGQLAKPTLYFRLYLTVIRRSHRLALTKLLLSDHSLASERMRWIKHTDRPPRQMRKCRICKDQAETPEHIMFICDMPKSTGANRLRKSILKKLDIQRERTTDEDEAQTIIRRAIQTQHTIDELAELAYTTYTYTTKTHTEVLNDPH